VTEIRSYRRVFELERRIYSVDRFRLNPGGVPVRGVVYFAGSVAGALITSRLPTLGDLWRVLPWYLRYIACPALLAGGMTALRLDGRPFHLSIGPLLGLLLRSRRRVRLGTAPSCARVWRPPDLAMIPDGSDPDFRGLRYYGPGSVLVSLAHERAWSRDIAGAGEIRVTAGLGAERPRKGTVIVLRPGARLRVMPSVGPAGN
jgi:hypothetical protein